MDAGKFPRDFRKSYVCVCVCPICTLKKSYLDYIQGYDPFPEDAVDVKPQDRQQELEQSLPIFTDITRA